MAHSSMQLSQQSAALFLAPGEARRLPAERRARCLRVTAGRLWLTRTGGGEADGDRWLAAGDALWLRPGDEVVVEGWPSARVQLQAAAGAAPVCQPPQAARTIPA